MTTKEKVMIIRKMQVRSPKEKYLYELVLTDIECSENEAFEEVNARFSWE